LHRTMWWWDSHPIDEVKRKAGCISIEAAIYHGLAYLRQRVRHVHGAGNLFSDV
jgi:hypothetical protein